MDKSKAKSVHILFEFCLQSSCITKKAVETLSSKPVDGGNIKIKTLGKKNNDKKFIYKYKFKIKTLLNNFSLLMKALCVANISDLINVLMLL